MHNAVVVVTHTERVNQRGVYLFEVNLKSSDNVLGDDLHMLVAIWTALFVPKTNNMADLVKDGVKLEAGAGKRHALPAIANPANV